MNRLQNKLIVGASSLLIFGALTLPAFADTTISVENNIKEGGWVFGTDSAFENIFDQFFGNRFKASMSGTKEVPGPGDPDGIGDAKVRLKPKQNQVCVDIDTKYIDNPTAAHIHHAPQGSTGAVVVPLPKPDENGEVDTCADIDPTLIKAIKENPQDYYVNVHTIEFPDGAIRGQLSK